MAVSPYMNRDIIVLPDHECVSRKAASLFEDVTVSSLKGKGECSVALSGGSTPKRLFSILASEYRNSVAWSDIDLFWVDERCVPPDHVESNFRIVSEAVLSRVAVPEGRVHRIRGEAEPHGEALRYEREIMEWFHMGGVPCFDLIILGMGADGHTASLFPGSDSLLEKDRLVLPVYEEKVKQWRISLTLPVINNGRSVVFLVYGKEKAPVLHEVLEGREETSRYPAGLIHPSQGKLIWLVDEPAASNLGKSMVASFISAAKSYNRLFH
jgi:6-phosphogluconolactonase